MEENRRKIRTNKLKEAVKAYFFLINSNFNTQQALATVQSHYLLNDAERALVQRCVHTKDYISRTLNKIVQEQEIVGNNIAIDYYNVITTIAEALEGFCLYRCTDYFVRDLASSFGRSKKHVSLHEKSLNLLKKFFLKYKPSSILLVADRQISHSAEQLNYAKRIFRDISETKTILVDSADKALIYFSKEDYIVGSSDMLIIDGSKRVVDIAYLSLNNERLLGKNLVEVWSYLF